MLANQMINAAPHPRIRVRAQRRYKPSDSVYTYVATVILLIAMAKRGSSVCQECNTFNGNRAQRCKICSKPMRKVAKSVDNVEFSCNVTSLLSAEATARIKAAFSVKTRDQGPDYRCFVRV